MKMNEIGPGGGGTSLGLRLGSANVNGPFVQQFACDLEIKLFFVSLKTLAFRACQRPSP